jgi:hypothetical protein
MTITLLLLISLFLPYIIWPIEQFLPYPHIVEELAKGLLVYFLVNEKLSRSAILVVSLFMGLFFALTESVFYIANIWLVGNVNTFIIRLLLTIPLHSLTTLAIALPSSFNKKLIIIGVAMAILIHFFYNRFIAINLQSI